MLARAFSTTRIGKIRRKLSHFNSNAMSLMTYSFVFLSGHWRSYHIFCPSVRVEVKKAH